MSPYSLEDSPQTKPPCPPPSSPFLSQIRGKSSASVKLTGEEDKLLMSQFSSRERQNDQPFASTQREGSCAPNLSQVFTSSRVVRRATETTNQKANRKAGLSESLEVCSPAAPVRTCQKPSEADEQAKADSGTSPFESSVHRSQGVDRSFSTYSGNQRSRPDRACSTLAAEPKSLGTDTGVHKPQSSSLPKKADTPGASWMSRPRSKMSIFEKLQMFKYNLEAAGDAASKPPGGDADETVGTPRRATRVKFDTNDSRVSRLLPLSPSAPTGVKSQATSGELAEPSDSGVSCHPPASGSHSSVVQSKGNVIAATTDEKFTNLLRAETVRNSSSPSVSPARQDRLLALCRTLSPLVGGSQKLENKDSKTSADVWTPVNNNTVRQQGVKRKAPSDAALGHVEDHVDDDDYDVDALCGPAPGWNPVTNKKKCLETAPTT